MEAERSMVKVSRHGAAATKDHGAVVRPSQLIASVGRTKRASVGGRNSDSATGVPVPSDA